MESDPLLGPKQRKMALQWPRKRIIATSLCVLLFITVDMAAFLSIAPQLRLYESIVCARYYKNNDSGFLQQLATAPEKYCKINPIQEEIATLTGFQAFFDAIPGILLAVPFGILADSYGRHKILVLTSCGIVLSYAWTLLVCWVGFPIHLVWLSSAFLVLGGGSSVGSAFIVLILSDVTPEAERSTAFFYLQACAVVSEFIAPLIASIIMGKNVWIPLLVALAMQTSSVLLSLLMPETRPHKPGGQNTEDLGYDEEDNQVEESDNSNGMSIRRRYREISRFLLQDINVALLTLTFFVATIGRQSLDFLLQYVSRRYGWTIGQASSLLSVRAGINLVLLIVILPTLSSYLLKRWGFGSEKKDLWLARGSIIFTVLGFIGIGLSPYSAIMCIGLVLYTLGSGFSVAVRSLVTSLVDSSNIAQLYTAISVLDTCGSLIAGPILSGTFKLGLRLGGGWISLPYIFAAGLFGLIAVIIYSAKLDTKDEMAGSYEPVATE